MGRATMFVKVLLTAVALLAVAAATVVIDCAAGVIEFLDGDPLGVCPVVGSLPDDTGLWLGLGLGILGVLLFVVVWIVRPASRPRGPEVVGETLVQNLPRLADVRAGATEVGPGSDEHAARLTLRLDAVVTSLEGDAANSREATRQWIALLREANDLHNRGELTTEDFKTVNTRLLDLFSAPGERSLAATRAEVSSQSR